MITLRDKTCPRCGAEFKGTTDIICLNCKNLRGGRGHVAAGTPLTLRQIQVVQLVTKGYTNKQIAHELLLSEGTIKEYMVPILQKTGASNRTELAVAWASQHCERYKTDVQQHQTSAEEAEPSHRDDGKKGTGIPGAHRAAFRFAIPEALDIWQAASEAVVVGD